MGSHPSSNKIEREFHNGVCQRQCPHGGTSIPQWPSPVAHVIRVSSSCLLPPQEPLQDQQMGLTQDFFKWLLLRWVLECVEFCVCSLFPTALVLLKVSPAGLHRQMSGDSSSQCRPLGWGVSVGLWPLAPWEAALQLKIIPSPHLGVVHPGVWALTTLHLIPLTCLPPLSSRRQILTLITWWYSGWIASPCIFFLCCVFSLELSFPGGVLLSLLNFFTLIQCFGFSR